MAVGKWPGEGEGGIGGGDGRKERKWRGRRGRGAVGHACGCIEIIDGVSVRLLTLARRIV